MSLRHGTNDCSRPHPPDMPDRTLDKKLRGSLENLRSTVAFIDQTDLNILEANEEEQVDAMSNVYVGRPDVTSEVDWALKVKYISIFLS